MKILIVGILTFLVWSSVSTYIYVCKIKGLCAAPQTLQISENNTPAKVNDTLQKQMIIKHLTVPKDLIIYFAFDKSEFNSNSFNSSYFFETEEYLKQNKQAGIEISGHTDAIGTTTYNDALGLRRAKSVQQYLESKGLLYNTMKIISLGESKPAESNTTDEGREKNRRTVITIK